MLGIATIGKQFREKYPKSDRFCRKTKQWKPPAKLQVGWQRQINWGDEQKNQGSR